LITGSRAVAFTAGVVVTVEIFVASGRAGVVTVVFVIFARDCVGRTDAGSAMVVVGTDVGIVVGPVVATVVGVTVSGGTVAVVEGTCVVATGVSFRVVLDAPWSARAGEAMPAAKRMRVIVKNMAGEADLKICRAFCSEYSRSAKWPGISLYHSTIGGYDG